MNHVIVLTTGTGNTRFLRHICVFQIWHIFCIIKSPHYKYRKTATILILTHCNINITITSILKKALKKSLILTRLKQIRTNHHTMTEEKKKSFIVTLKDSASPAAVKESIHKLGGEITHEYNLIKGFAVKLPASFHINSLKEHKDVANVEEDKEVSVNKTT